MIRLSGRINSIGTSVAIQERGATGSITFEEAGTLFAENYAGGAIDVTIGHPPLKQWKLIADGGETEVGRSRIIEVDGGRAIGGFIEDSTNPQEIVDSHNAAWLSRS